MQETKTGLTEYCHDGIYLDFTLENAQYKLTGLVNNQTVEAFITEITYEDYLLRITIRGKNVVVMSGCSLKELKSFTYGFLRGMDEMGVVIRDIFNL